MQVFEEPNKQEWEALLKRPNFDAAELLPKVQSILDTVALAVELLAAAFFAGPLTLLQVCIASFSISVLFFEMLICRGS